MKTKLFISLLCAFLALGLVFQSCEDDDTPQVGVCLKNPSNDFRKALKTHAENSLNDYGLTYSIEQSESETKQENAIQAMVDKGCEVVIVTPEGEPKEVLNKIINAGFPVVFVESAPVTGYKTLIEISNSAIGESAASFFNKQEIKKVALFSITQDVASSTARISGIKAKLDSAIEVQEFTLATYTKAAGKSATDDILRNNPDIDAIYAQDDEIALGVLEAITAAKSQQIKSVVGCGGSASYFKEIKDTESINLATTLYSPQALMEAAVEAADKIIKNQSIENKISLPSELVDKTNVDTHLKNPPY